MKLIYVAGPFRHETHWGIDENVHRAKQVGIQVAQFGAMPVIPHSMTQSFHGEGTEQFWLDGTMALLRACQAVILVRGWQRSSGTKREIEEAAKLGIPVFEQLSELHAWLTTEAS